MMMEIPAILRFRWKPTTADEREEQEELEVIKDSKEIKRTRQDEEQRAQKFIWWKAEILYYNIVRSVMPKYTPFQRFVTLNIVLDFPFHCLKDDCYFLL